MKKIFITPKFKYNKIKNEITFSYDPRWLSFFDKEEFEVVFYHKNILDSISSDSLVLFSGGNNLSSIEENTENKLRDSLENELYEKVIRDEIKHLGICRGAQFIFDKSGGAIKKVEKHAGITHNLFYPKNSHVISDVKFVLSHHNYGLEYTNDDKFKIISLDEHNFIEMFKIDRIALGLMWHPERQNDSIQKIFINYLNGWLDE